MSRLMLAAALCLSAPLSAAADDMARITLRGSYDGAHVYRGTQLGEDTANALVEVSVPQRGREFYGGLALAAPLSQPDGAFEFNDEYRIFAGAAFNWWDGVWIDVGYTQFLYSNDGPGIFHNGQERGVFHLGGFVDVELLNRDFEPSAFLYYDLEREELQFEIDLQYSHLVGPNLYVDLGGHAGAAISANGTERTVVGGVLVERPIEEYAFYGLEADLRFDFSGRAEAFAGGRVGGASEDRFIDAFAPTTGLPSRFESMSSWLTAGVRVDF